MLWEGKIYQNGSYPVKVKDTFGAGDSFLASLISKLLSGKNPDSAFYFASAVGALAASHSGANPKLKNEEIERFMSRKV